MKACILSLLLGIAFTDLSFGQGAIGYGNRIPAEGIDARVFDIDCLTPLEGRSYFAQAFVGLTPQSLDDVGPILTFGFGASSGYISEHNFNIPGVGNQLVYTQLRAWEASAGATYETAVAAGGKYGFSNIVPMQSVIGPGAPRVPNGLRSFCLVPEPSTWTLLALGAIGLCAAVQRLPTVA